jgi:hypothetical protein
MPVILQRRMNVADGSRSLNSCGDLTGGFAQGRRGKSTRQSNSRRTLTVTKGGFPFGRVCLKLWDTGLTLKRRRDSS